MTSLIRDDRTVRSPWVDSNQGDCDPTFFCFVVQLASAAEAKNIRNSRPQIESIST